MRDERIINVSPTESCEYYVARIAIIVYSVSWRRSRRLDDLDICNGSSAVFNINESLLIFNSLGATGRGGETGSLAAQNVLPAASALVKLYDPRELRPLCTHMQ